jgi:hypothetical protein
VTVVKACLLKHIKNAWVEKLREATRNRVESYSMSIIKASSGLMHMSREMYLDVTHMETVEVPGDFFDKTILRHLMLSKGEARRENELVHAFHENHSEYHFNGTRSMGDWGMFTYGAMKYLTNLKKHMIVNLERFMIGAVFALYPGASRKGIWAIINGITKDHKREDEIQFVDKKASNESTNEASVIRAVMQEHRTVLELANPAEKVSELKKIRKDTTSSY